MKIINIIQCTELGGMEQVSLRLMKAMQERGHNFELISLNPIGGLGPLLNKADITTTGLDYGRCGKIRTLLRLRKIVSRSNADALIMTGHNLAASLALFGVSPKRRLLAMHYHHEGVMPKWRWRMIYRVALNVFGTVTFASNYVRCEAEAIFSPIQSISKTVYNPLEVRADSINSDGKSLRLELGIPLNAPIIGNAGWLIDRKRFDVFLKTAAKVLLVKPEAHFLIAGDGEQRAALERLSEELGLSHRTHFVGWLVDMDSFYDAINILLFNSDWDAFGMTPIEALSRGIPVVASLKNGGLGEILNESTGWLGNQHNVQILCQNVVTALGPEGRRRGIAGRKLLAEKCDPQLIAESIESSLLSDGS